MVRLVEGDTGEQGADGCRAGIAGSRTVAAFVPGMVEEVADEVGVDVPGRQALRWRTGDLAGIGDGQPEGVAVAGDGVATDLTLPHECRHRRRHQLTGCRFPVAR